MKRKALGKGLSSLIPSSPPAEPRKPAPSRTGVLEIDVDLIRPNPQQPRQAFEPEALEALATSLREHGFLQPVTVRPAGGDGYELVAGERRWRAAQRAGLPKVPAVVRDVPDDRLLEFALIENLQREGLNPIEEAEGYRRLVDELGLSQQEAAERVGKQRATVANMLRLLTLPRAVQDRVRGGELGMGHARALAGLSRPKDQVELAERIVANGLSVRQAEAAVARLATRDASAGERTRAASKRDPNVVAAEERLQAAVGTRVRIVQGKNGAGRLELHFFSDEELQRVYDLVLGGTRRR